LFANKDKNINQMGFTLIEIIVAVFIIAIMAAAFLPLLTNSFSGIFQSSSRQEALYQVQTNIEGLSNDNDDNAITIKDQSGTTITRIDGKMHTVTNTVNNNTVSINVFIPKE